MKEAPAGLHSTSFERVIVTHPELLMGDASLNFNADSGSDEHKSNSIPNDQNGNFKAFFVFENFKDLKNFRKFLKKKAKNFFSKWCNES